MNKGETTRRLSNVARNTRVMYTGTLVSRTSRVSILSIAMTGASVIAAAFLSPSVKVSDTYRIESDRDLERKPVKLAQAALRITSTARSRSSTSAR